MSSAAIEAENAVRKAAFWSDGGAEFVFGDGSVMVFRDSMDTFAFAAPNAPSELVITALCLSKHRAKVRNALAVFNAVAAPNPKLISGLLPDGAEQVWRNSSPIDTLVLSASPELQNFDPEVGTFTLSCALKRTFLTIHKNSPFFTVRWPARVLGADNSPHVFVNPVDQYGRVSSALATFRAVRFTIIEQRFDVETPPREWAAMLMLAIRLAQPHFGADGAVAAEADTEPSALLSMIQNVAATATVDDVDAVERLLSSGQTADDATIVRSLPQTLDAVRHGDNMHFAELRQDDVALLVAANQLPAASCMHRFHPPAGGKALVTHTFDALWGWAQTRGPTHPLVVVSFVPEDESAVVVEPNGETAFAVTHISKRTGKMAVYHQSADSSTTVPRALPPSFSSSTSPPSSLTRGRYLPEVVLRCVSMANENAARIAAVRGSSTRAHLVSPVGGVTPDAASGYVPVVFLTTRVDDVGTFAALSNGIIRVTFDDRTIVSLTPDEIDSEAGLVCTIIDSDATVQHIRVVQITPEHKAYPYLQYALSFRRFSQLTAEEQRGLQYQLPAAPSHVKPSMSFVPSSVTSQCGGADASFNEYQHQLLSTSAASGFGSIDELLERTRRVLNAVAETSKESTTLLKARI